jgi:ABC-type Fe3+/spermidine/putrescine transport system ATPase subunit
MVELQINAQRGFFDLQLECRLAAPWTVVFGPSGAGKSTLLRVIAGLDRPNYGRISIRGQYVLDTETGLDSLPGKRGVGLVAQQSALFPHLSVTANVAYGLASLSRAAKQQRVCAMLDLVGASHLAARSPRALSGGEAQRVSLARALAPSPHLLLLDEPLSALDAGARDQVLTRLQGWLGEQEIQTILVTHDAADALATEAEVALLLEGKLAAFGPAHEVLATERNRLLARLKSS